MNSKNIDKLLKVIVITLATIILLIVGVLIFFIPSILTQSHIVEVTSSNISEYLNMEVSFSNFTNTSSRNPITGLLVHTATADVNVNITPLKDVIFEDVVVEVSISTPLRADVISSGQNLWDNIDGRSVRIPHDGRTGFTQTINYSNILHPPQHPPHDNFFIRGVSGTIRYR